MSKTMQFEFNQECCGAGATFASQDVSGFSATITSVADFWHAEVYRDEELVAEQSFPIKEYAKAVEFCNLRLFEFLVDILPWRKAEVFCENMVYHEWNHFSDKQQAHYKIFQEGRSKDSFSCLTLIYDNGALVPFRDTIVYDNLQDAKKHFLHYENHDPENL